MEDRNALIIENGALKSFKSFALYRIKSMNDQELLDANKKFKKNQVVMEMLNEELKFRENNLKKIETSK